MVLQRVELVIPPVPGQQLLVSALLQNFAVREHNDVVRVLNGGQAVSHNEHSAHRAHLFQRILDQQLGLGVDVGGGLVQDHHAGLVQDGAGKAEQLALACREVVAPLPDFLVQAVVQLVDEVVRIDIAADLHNFFIRDVLLPQDDVGADGARKEENILQHLAKVLPQAGNFDLADVDAVNQNLTSLELIVAADEGENRALAGAR